LSSLYEDVLIDHDVFFFLVLVDAVRDFEGEGHRDFKGFKHVGTSSVFLFLADGEDRLLIGKERG
jgi:hypothetical protein